MDNDAWLAGLLEGEGSFQKGPPSQPGKPRVLDILGVMSFQEHGFRNPSWKTCYRVQVSGQRAVDLMARIRPMMGERRKAQIDAAIACWNPIAVRNRERNEAIIRLHEQGELNYSQIAAELGLTRQAVRQVVVRYRSRRAA
jgi:hypothetical protein